MNNENPTNTPVVEENDNTNYIQAIQDLKANSVDRERYNKLKEERDTLIQALANGDTLPAGSEVQVRSLADCRKDFIIKSKSQCEYVEKLLALREAAIREGHTDPFVGEGHHLKPNAYTFQRAQEVADIYRECLDYANGDDAVFMNEIQRRIR